jgi:hypothetical protein
LDRIHNIFYPIDWQETNIDIQKLWLINECKTKEDIEKANILFENPEFLKDKSVRNKVS